MVLARVMQIETRVFLGEMLTGEAVEQKRKEMERRHERSRRSASRERLLSRLSFAASGVAAASNQQQQLRASAAASGPTNFSTLASIGVRLGAIEDHNRCMTTEIQ